MEVNTAYYMQTLNGALHVVVSGMSCGIIISVGILCIKQVLHIFTISSK